MDEPGDYLTAEAEAQDRREIETLWLKPGRIGNPFPGVRLIVNRTNGDDAEVTVSLDRAEVIGND